MVGNIKFYLYVLVLAALLGVGWYVHHLRSEVQDLISQKADLTAKLDLQNAAVEQMRQDGELRLKAAQDALTKAQAETAQAKDRANKFYKAKPGTDACKSALDLVNGT